MGQEDLVDRIAAGTATLLGIDDICKRLGISRTTFDRWVRNGSEQPIRTTRTSTLLENLERRNTMARLMDVPENAAEGNICFPPPDIRIGNSPKWELETFKAWLRANIKK